MTRREFLGAGLAAGAGLAVPSLGLSTRPNGVKTARLAEDRFEVVVPKHRNLRIMQIADTHFGAPTERERAGDKRSQALIRELIREHRPDFLFHTGDFINNDKDYVEFGAIAFMNELGLPWSLVFGNHDHPDGGPGQKTLDEYAGSLGNAMLGSVKRSDGSRDYCFRVDLRAQGDKPFASIFAFNTGPTAAGMKVSDSQTEWFLKQMEADKSASISSPILVMQHVPTIEYRDVYSQHLAIGRQGESVCFEQDKGEIFEHYAQSGRVRAIFCGHDHVNDYVGALRGINLVYGRCSGYSGYGDWERGARLIDVDARSGLGTTRVVLGKAAHEKPEWSQTLAVMKAG